jgi:riboflavin synthase alpha subunit
VTGHVDAIGTLATSTQTANAWEMRFTAPPSANSGWQRQIAPYIVSKGSIAVNGISLTVANMLPNFSVVAQNRIPNLGKKPPQSTVWEQLHQNS